MAENESSTFNNTCSTGEEMKPDVVVKQEKVIPLRSKGKLDVICFFFLFRFDLKDDAITFSNVCSYTR